ncbi:MAG: TetR/AcrR family transcriptional regulator [Myxococcales bacterium]
MAKGEETRDRIVRHALELSSTEGLEGISIGVLASDLGLSKSGLFAHFGSKEELQVAILQRVAQRFEHEVLLPAFRAPRGEPRIRRVFDRWMDWMSDAAQGGCPFAAASFELDDKVDSRPRDYLVTVQRMLLTTLARAAQIAKEEGHFRSDLDTEQFAFDLDGIMLSYSHWKRLLRDAKAEARARAGFEALLVRSRRSLEPIS